MSETIEKIEVVARIKRIRDYLNYLEEHWRNVQKAWADIQNKCQDFIFMADPTLYEEIDHAVREHDLSKFSEEEFIRYREKFFPTAGEMHEDISEIRFGAAWDHHKRYNDHHWETMDWSELTTPVVNSITNFQILKALVHMVVDWVAMSYTQGDTAQEYYESKRGIINFPPPVEIFIYSIFERLYPDAVKIDRAADAMRHDFIAEYDREPTQEEMFNLGRKLGYDEGRSDELSKASSAYHQAGLEAEEDAGVR